VNNAGFDRLVPFVISTSGALGDKAKKFLIEPSKEERIISEIVDILKNTYYPLFKDVNVICTACALI
jgi:hypothetical protein